MKAKLLCFSFTLLTLFAAHGQGTAFTYQGRLNDGAVPASGSYDLTFTLFGVNAGGVAVVSPVTNNATAVSNGLFMAIIDFGPDVFTGSSNWIEIGVRTNGSVTFNTLTPRQQLTPVPNAIFANTASNLSGTLPAAQLSGTIPATSLSGTLALAQLPATVLTNNESAAVTFGNTFGLPDPATIFTGSGTLLISSFSSGNFFAGPATGNRTMSGSFNTASGRFALLANTSGSGNVAIGANAMDFNTSGGNNAVVGASALLANTTGQNNAAFGAQALGDNSVGNNNTALGTKALQSNTGNNNVGIGYLAGISLTTGSNNIDIGNLGVAGESGVIRIGNPGDQTSTFIAGTLNGDAGGLTNLNPSQFALGSGISVQQNPGTGAPDVIEGSPVNFVANGVVGATIGGGGATNFFGQAYTNSVTGVFGTVNGGRQNTANLYATVSGGDGNTASGNSGVVGGGLGNTASANYSAVGGGVGNTAAGFISVVSGGDGNTANNSIAAVGGGAFNFATNFAATVPGGESNVAGGVFSFAAGQQAQATNTGAFVWADSQNAVFSSTNSDSFNVRASGGVRFVTGGAGMLIDGQPAFGTGGGISVQQNPGTGAPNVIEGSQNNFVASGVVGATIGGGGATNSSGSAYSNRVTASFGTVAGGRQNFVDGQDSFIGGGIFNIADGATAAVVGGSFNHADGNLSAVGGGTANTASGNNSVVAGGTQNTASALGAVVIGGANNFATNANATVAGGSENVAGGTSSFAAGRRAYAVNNSTFVWADSQIPIFQSTASDQFLIRSRGGVGIGTNNPSAILHVSSGTSQSQPQAQLDQTTSGDFSRLRFQASTNPYWDLAVGGTAPNNVMNWFVNGFGNIMSLQTNGTLTVAGEVVASSSSGPSLNVSGNRTGDFNSSVAFIQNTSTSASDAPALRIVGNGGETYGALSVSSQNASHTGLIAQFGNATAFVVAITNDGTIYSKGLALTSDRNAKENFTPLDSKMVLAKIAAMPVTTWNYKDDSADKKHIGPVAQDFSAAFGLNGNDDQHISVVDESGVALAAIQGLNQKVDELNGELKRRDAENADLKHRLEKLERLLSAQSSGR